MYFGSDNCAGIHPKISENLAKHGNGFASSYGNSDLDKMVEQTFSEVFERDLWVFFVATGTAANSLALAAASKPGGVALCHSEAHVIEDECGAPEFFSNANRLAPVSGKFGKIDLNSLEAEFSRLDPDFVHHGRPSAATITQATEIGTLYSLEETSDIADVCSKNSVPLHMDGARFANALVSLDVSPAEMTWKQGVEFVSFGGTKNGCWCAEALICFDETTAYEINFLRKRSGQLFSKSRFIAAQFEAYFEDGLWLDLARHSNQMAAKLGSGINECGNAQLAWDYQSNEVFAIMEPKRADELKSKGAVFFEWLTPRDHPDLIDDAQKIYRFVTSFATEEKEVDAFLKALG